MKCLPSRISLLAIAALLAIAGCYSDKPQGSVTLDTGERLTVAVPKAVVTIPQGGEAKISVVVTREKLEGPVQVEITGLPEGVSVADGELTFDEKAGEKLITLRAEVNAPPEKEHRATVKASHEKLSTAAALTITVEQSLENLAAQKKAFSSKMEERLGNIQKQLKAAEQKAKQLKAEGKAKFLEELSDLNRKLTAAREKYNTLIASPVESWERHKDEVEDAVGELEQETQTISKQLNNVKEQDKDKS